MITQIVNLSKIETYKEYKSLYNFLGEYRKADFWGIEISETKYISPSNELNEFLTSHCQFIEKNKNILLVCDFEKILQLKRLLKENQGNEFCNKLSYSISNCINYDKIRYRLGKNEFDFRYPYLMGILNVTPDSFSDGGKYFSKENALRAAFKMLDEGADIIDIGGESTRPGSDAISEDEEIDRIIPVIEEIIKEYPDAIISADTYKSKVAEAALKSGATIINDISGGVFEPSIMEVTAKNSAAFVIMHSSARPKIMQEKLQYKNLISDIYKYICKQSNLAISKGIDKLFIDPGIGFGKRLEDNFKIINRLDDFKSLGFPILIGLSRKSFLGKALNLEINERDEATAIAETLALNNGAKILRTHNIKLGKLVKDIYKLTNYKRDV